MYHFSITQFHHVYNYSVAQFHRVYNLSVPPFYRFYNFSIAQFHRLYNFTSAKRKYFSRLDFRSFSFYRLRTKLTWSNFRAPRFLASTGMPGLWGARDPTFRHFSIAHFHRVYNFFVPKPRLNSGREFWFFFLASKRPSVNLFQKSWHSSRGQGKYFWNLPQKTRGTKKKSFYFLLGNPSKTKNQNSRRRITLERSVQKDWNYWGNTAKRRT